MFPYEELSVNGDGIDIAAELQEDILKLKRQYRLLKEDRKAYASESGQILNWQHQIIAELMKEEGDLLTDMKVVAQSRNRFTDKKMADKLRGLAESEDAMKSAIKDESTKIQIAEENCRKQMQEVVVSSHYKKSFKPSSPLVFIY